MRAINFSGQVGRNRNVNLGGKQSSAVSRASLLKKSQLERQKREQQRKQENALKTIGYFIRRYLTRRCVARKLMAEFLDDEVGYNVKNSEELASRLRQFNFFIRNLFPAFRTNLTGYDLIRCLRKTLRILERNPVLIEELESSILVKFSNVTVELLDVFKQVLVGSQELKDSQLTPMALEGINLLSQITVCVCDKSVLESLIVTLILILQTISNRELRSSVRETLNHLGVEHSKSFPAPFALHLGVLLRLNCLDNSTLVQLQPGIFDFYACLNSSDPSDHYLNQFRSMEVPLKLATLVALLQIMPESAQGSEKVIKALANVLSALGRETLSALVVSEEEGEGDRNEVSPTSRIRPDAPFKMVENTRSKPRRRSDVFKVSQEAYSKLQWLTTREFVHSYFTAASSESSQSLVDAFPSVFTTLLRLFPTQKSTILMYLSLQRVEDDNKTSISLMHYLLHSLLGSTLFTQVLEEEFALVELLATVRTNNSSTEASEGPWHSYVLFLELYSFWLIVADDDEFHGKATGEASSIPLDTVRLLARFLERFCFSLIWNSYSTTHDTARRLAEESLELSRTVGVSLKALKKVSLQVLHQLYLRDSRRSFTDEDFWTYKGTRQENVEDFRRYIGQVAQEEELRSIQREEDNLSDDEEEYEAFEAVDTSDTRKTSNQHRGFLDEEVNGSANTRENTSVFDGDQELVARAGIRVLRDNVDNGNSSMGRSSGLFSSSNSSSSSKSEMVQIMRLLEILEKMPFCIEFLQRANILQNFIALDKAQHDNSSQPFNPFLPPRETGPKVVIRRTNVFEDAYEGLGNLGSKLKQTFAVTFHDQFGNEEAGIDGGGLAKEFLTSVVAEAFNPGESGPGLFTETPEKLLYPNPSLGIAGGYLSEEQREFRTQQLHRLKFLGNILGRCIYEGVLVDVSFATFFLQKFGPRSKLMFEDLYSLDPQLYRNLQKLLKYPRNVEEDMGLNFTLTQEIEGSRPVTVELVPGGSDIPVTNANRLTYVHAVADYKLNQLMARPTAAFVGGVWELISPLWLGMFSPRELQMLISGGEAEIDVEDLKNNVEYDATYQIDIQDPQSTISLFWEVLREMSGEERKQFVKFVTSVPRAPLLGFGALRPKIGIRCAGNDVSRLPTASTCFNLLKLPDYKDKELLRKKLLYSIRAGAGFDLS